MFVYICSESRSHACLAPQRRPTKSPSVSTTSVQPICFLTLTDSSAQRLMSNDFPLNHLRTLFTATVGVPYSSLFLTSLRHYILFSNSFTCNTYESSRKCCKQKTYDLDQAL